MQRLITLFLLALLLVSTASAQDDDSAEPAPDYQVSNTSYDVSEDGQDIIVVFSVYNSGGAAETEAEVQLVELRNSSVVIAETTLEPLEGRGGTAVDVPLRFPVTLYAPGESVALNVIVNLPDDTATLNNAQVVNVTIPNYTAPSQNQGPLREESSDEGDDLPVDLWWMNIGIDLGNNSHVAILLGFLIVLMLIALFIRLFLSLFRRSPVFGNWQPPYATMPPLDPQSTYGRRQAWQQHAQNNIVQTPCKTGQIQARKVLLGMDGAFLSGWKITALRMTQYDMYGRVARSQVLATGGMTRRLTRTAQKAGEGRLTEEQIARRVRPVARGLAKQFRRKISKRSAMLPIALDVRLRGTHGEVRIIFELYECINGLPSKIDFWEPEMTVVGKTIYESFTFTIYGQTNSENFKLFRKRLAVDIERVLTEMMRVYAGAQDPTPAHAGPSADPLSGTQPGESYKDPDTDEDADLGPRISEDDEDYL